MKETVNLNIVFEYEGSVYDTTVVLDRHENGYVLNTDGKNSDQILYYGIEEWQGDSDYWCITFNTGEYLFEVEFDKKLMNTLGIGNAFSKVYVWDANDTDKPMLHCFSKGVQINCK